MPRSGWLTQREFSGIFVDFSSHITLFGLFVVGFFFFCLIGPFVCIFGFSFCCAFVGFSMCISCFCFYYLFKYG